MAYIWHTFWYTNWYTKRKILHKMNKMKIIEHKILKDIKIKTQYGVWLITYKPEIELVRQMPRVRSPSSAPKSQPLKIAYFIDVFKGFLFLKFPTSFPQKKHLLSNLGATAVKKFNEKRPKIDQLNFRSKSL